MASKGKLRAGSKIVDLEEEQPLINNNAPQIVVEYEALNWGTIIFSWFKTIFLFFILGIFLLISTYAGLAATIMYITPVDKGSEYVAVARGTFTGGKIPAGTNIYVSTTDNIENSFISNLMEGFNGVKNGAIVKTVAGPVQEISVNSKKETIILYEDGVISDTIEGTLPEEFNNIELLKNEYLVKCVSGACDTNTYLVIKQEQISGEVIQLSKR